MSGLPTTGILTPVNSEKRAETGTAKALSIPCALRRKLGSVGSGMYRPRCPAPYRNSHMDSGREAARSCSDIIRDRRRRRWPYCRRRRGDNRCIEEIVSKEKELISSWCSAGSANWSCSLFAASKPSGCPGVVPRSHRRLREGLPWRQRIMTSAWVPVSVPRRPVTRFDSSSCAGHPFLSATAFRRSRDDALVLQFLCDSGIFRIDITVIVVFGAWNLTKSLRAHDLAGVSVDLHEINAKVCREFGDLPNQL